RRPARGESPMHHRTSLFAVALASFAVACGGSSASAPPPATEAPATPPAPAAGETTPASDIATYKAIVDAPDRDAADRKLDEGRKPAELLAFMGIKPG